MGNEFLGHFVSLSFFNQDSWTVAASFISSAPMYYTRRQKSAIHNQNMARDVTRLIAGQKYRRKCGIFGRAVAVHRNASAIMSVVRVFGSRGCVI
ncbi:MAG: hypothetical protein ACI9ZD_002576 [Paracoccaceae bacterium]|jgi:hypothetical protein